MATQDLFPQAEAEGKEMGKTVTEGPETFSSGQIISSEFRTSVSLASTG